MLKYRPLELYHELEPLTEEQQAAIIIPLAQDLKNHRGWQLVLHILRDIEHRALSRLMNSSGNHDHAVGQLHAVHLFRLGFSSLLPDAQVDWADEVAEDTHPTE